MSKRKQYFDENGEVLIHRDKRRPDESSSALGAIIGRVGPHEIAMMDIDACFHKKHMPDETQLLRIVEHKTPRAKLSREQDDTLEILDHLLLDAVNNPPSWLSKRLHPSSRVYIIRGDIKAETEQEEVFFKGPQVITLLDGKGGVTLASMEDMNDWLCACSASTRNWTPRKRRPGIRPL